VPFPLLKVTICSNLLNFPLTKNLPDENFEFQKVLKSRFCRTSMPMTFRNFKPGPTCTCTPPDENNWKLIQFTQGMKTIKCEKCGEYWNENDPGNDPVWKQSGMY